MSNPGLPLPWLVPIQLASFKLFIAQNLFKLRPETEGSKRKEIPLRFRVELTNRFHVAVRLFSDRSLMTSNCVKNKAVAHEPQESVSLMFLPQFDVICDLLLNRRTTKRNLFVDIRDDNKGRGYCFQPRLVTLTSPLITGCPKSSFL